MITKYNKYALFALTVGVLGCAAVWRWANIIYRDRSQLAGWWVGVLGSMLPALALGAYLLWLRHQRALGQHVARVPWLNAALGLAVAFSVFLLLFSLM
jgi:hypothetical protein